MRGKVTINSCCCCGSCFKAVVAAAIVHPVDRKHIGRIYTEEKAKVVAAAWGTEFILFLAALAVLHQDDMKKRMNWTRMI